LKSVFSVDAEDWFHILDIKSAPDIEQWDRKESRVEKNLYDILDTFDTTETKITFFFLGWIAEKIPKLVKEADERGHEIASHGYGHQLIYTQAPKEFADDIRKSKAILEDITGKQVLGYRAPGFSIIETTNWAFDELCKAGYRYDSSIFPASRGHGGIIGAKLHPHKIYLDSGILLEFPITVVNIIGKKLCYSGGGYLRIFPYPVIRYLSKVVKKDNRPVIYYIHPREIDPDHPRLRMGFFRYFKSYVNLHTTKFKVKKLLQDEELTTFRDFLADKRNWNQYFEC